MKTGSPTHLSPIDTFVSLGGGGGEVTSGYPSPSGYPPSGQVPTANGSNGWAWGSNVAVISVEGLGPVVGPFVQLAAGSNMVLTRDMPLGVASNTVRFHSTGGGGAAFGSNSTHVSETTQVGASSNSARADHYHRGIETITASSSNTMQRGTWNLRPGAGIALSLTDTDGDGEFDTTTIVNTGSGGGGGGSVDDPVRNQIGNGAIIIPGFAAHPDIRVAGASDDEFDTTDTSDPMTGWTTLGSPTAHDTNSTAKSHYYLRPTTSASRSWEGIYKSSPSTPFTVTMHLGGFRGNNTFNCYGLFLAEASPGKIEFCGLRTQSGTVPTVGVYTLTSPTGTAALVSNTGVVAFEVWVRCVVNSTTSIDWEYSLNGLIYVPAVTAGRNPGFTIGAVGIGAMSEHATSFVRGVVDWIRFT